MPDPQAESYPMPMFATLAVRDMAAAIRWYESLGVQPLLAMPGPGRAPSLAHLRWAKYADLLLVPQSANVTGTKGTGISLTFMVSDGTVDKLAERARALGAKLLREPGDRPWNARDFTVADPDGFALTFSMGPLRKDLSFEDVVATARPR